MPATATSFIMGEPSISWKTTPVTRPATAPRTLPDSTRSTVQPGGLPARSSLRRMRSAVSAPEMRRPSPVALLCSGSRTRSAKDLSSSLLSSLGALVIASSTGSERVTPDSVEAVRAEPTRMIARRTSATPRMNRIVMSHLHLDQSAHPEDTDPEDRGGAREHRPAQRLLEHDDHVVVVRQQKVDHEQRRKATQHPG